MQPTISSLANFLDDLSATLKEAAETARKLRDREADLPPVLHTRHIAAHQDISPTTAWRKARLGEFGPLLSEPGEPVRIAREDYLRCLKPRREAVRDAPG
jgi:hypothetical protein